MYKPKKRLISNCTNCGNILSGRSDSKFCSNHCRIYYSNNKPKTEDKKKQLAHKSRMWYLITKTNTPERLIWFKTKQRARIKNITFNIDISDIVIPKKCPLLGIDLFFTKNKKHPTANSPSIDRKNPLLGYTKGNVWIISNKANMMKQDVDIDTLKLFCKNVMANL